MNGLDKIGAEAAQLVSINAQAQRTGLKPPGAMRYQIQISSGFDASLCLLSERSKIP
jgi:hypothetical protein